MTARLREAWEDRWREYEARKQAWLLEHPEATSKEYEAAMARIARETGA